MYVFVRVDKCVSDSHALGSQVSIHLVDLLLVNFGANVSLEFERRRQNVVLNREGVTRHEHLLGLLERVQFVGGGKGNDLIVDSLFEVHVLLTQQSLQRFTISVLRSPLRTSSFFDNNDGNGVIFERISIDHDLCDQGRLDVNIFEFFGGYILSLRQLENVLGTVQNLDRSVGENDAHVSRRQPTVLTDRLCSLIRPHEVPRCDHGSFHLNFAARVRLVVNAVVHFGQILQTDFAGEARTAYSASNGVIHEGYRRCSRSFRHAVGFANWCAQSDLQKLENGLVNGCGSSDRQTNPASQDCFDFAKDERIVAAVRVGRIAIQSVGLGGQGVPHEPSLATFGFGHGRVDLLVDLVVKARHRREQRWLQHLRVLSQLQRIPLKETQFGTLNQYHRENELFEDVWSGQVGNVGVFVGDLKLVREFVGGSHHVFVRDLHSLRISSRPRGVIEDVDV